MQPFLQDSRSNRVVEEQTQTCLDALTLTFSVGSSGTNLYVAWQQCLDVKISVEHLIHVLRVYFNAFAPITPDSNFSFRFIEESFYHTSVQSVIFSPTRCELPSLNPSKTIVLSVSGEEKSHARRLKRTKVLTMTAESAETEPRQVRPVV